MVDNEKPTPTFDDMKGWAEKAYQTDLEQIPEFVRGIVDNYKHTGISKVNVVNIAMTCMLKQFFDNKLFEMTEPEVDTAKWTLIKMLFPAMGDGPISLIKWNNLLSRTAEPYFKSISQGTFDDIRSTASLLYNKYKDEPGTYSPEDLAHWKSLIDGNVPFGYRIIEEEETPIPSE